MRGLPRVQQIPEPEVKSFSPEDLLPINTIREYTKTDDVPSITDEILDIYRKSALEAAEQYTGFLLEGTKRITENIEKPTRTKDRMRGYTVHKLEYPSADGRIYLYGSERGLQDRIVNVQPGSSTVRLPVLIEAFDNIGECCGSCRGGTNFGLKIVYAAGYYSTEAIPSGVILGCLKFVAWCVSNPGDIIQTLKNRKIAGEVGIVGSNNIALSSGALELWRQYNREAI